MRKLTFADFQALIKNSTVLTDDAHGKKVVQLTDHTIIKLFRVKRLISQATLYSPARRFANNAHKLKQLNIPTISMLDLYKINSIKRTAVHYQQLEGITVREYLQDHPAADDFLSALGEFLAQLHSKGIFFRSAHFGNIIYTSDKQFGLIDISDMKIYKSSLNISKRLRNLKHIFRLPEDIALVSHNTQIEQSYLEHSDVNTIKFHQAFLKKCRELKNAGN